jgi:iron complex outermembrane receptor protein
MKFPTSSFLFAASFVLLSFFSAIASFAQEGAEKTYVAEDTVVVIADRVTRIPTSSSVAAKMTIPLQQTPASVGVVTNALIENQDGVVLVDALKNVSGVNVQSGFGVFDYFVIRGFESLSNGLVLTDGAAEPEVTFYNLYNVERVEVLKGPSAFLYGGNPLSGTVNLVRKQPVFRNFLHLGGSYGQFQSYRNTLDVGLASLNSGVAFRLNALWQDSENYRDNKDNDNLSVNPALTWRMNDKTSLTANFEYVKSKYKPDSGVPLLLPDYKIPDVPRTRSYQLSSDISEQKIARLRLDFETRLSERITLRNKFYYTDLDWQSDGTLLFGAFPSSFGDIVFRSFTALDDRQKLAGDQLEAVLNFNTGALRHQVLAGLEVNRLDDKFTLGGVEQLLPILLHSPRETPANLVTSLFLKNDAKSVALAPYLVNQITFSEKLQAMIGGRFDAIDYDDTHSLPVPGVPGVLFTASTKREYQKFSPMLGVVFSPARNLSLYANAGKAFGPPSTLVIDDLDAEESKQIEAGVKTQFFNGKLNANLAAYHLEKNNLIIPDYTGFRYLSGEQRSRGVEIEITAQPRRNWQAFVAYAFNDAELTQFVDQTPSGNVDRSGNTPAFAPKHILNFWTNKEFKNGLGIGAGARYISSQFIDEDNLFEIDGYLLVDGMLYYNIGNWRWSLNFKNITDTEYETRGFGSASVIPGNPFAIYGAVEFKL